MELLLEEASPRPTKSDIVATVRQFVESSEELEGRASEVVASDNIALTVLRGSGPFITLEHSRGGNWLLTDGDYTCTSGWSVEGDDGDGIMTAARCDDMDEFEEPSED